MATIILAGGMSLRMGRDKALLATGGAGLLQSLVSRFDGKFGKVLVAAREEQSLALEEARIVHDIFRGRGPMGGIHAGLLASPDDLNFVLACDMPYASPAAARHLLSLAEDCDAVVPMLEHGPEPLHGVYRKTCVPLIEACLQNGDYRMRLILDRANTRYVREDDLRKVDPELRSFVNLNTPEDFERAFASESDVRAPIYAASPRCRRTEEMI